MSHPYLPKLKAGNRFKDPEVNGVWEERTKTDIDNLADAIDVPPGEHRIYSIPDPWARALLFDRALYHPEHSLHRLTTGEWRGVLAILGLKERRNFSNLSVRPVTLGRGPVEPGGFSAVLGTMLPRSENLVTPDTSWEQFHILRWQQVPGSSVPPRAFAFTSPMTLVCAGADYAGRLPSGTIPWFNGSYLTDPVLALSQRERTALSEWVWLLTHHEALQTSRFSGRRGDLIKALEQFAEDLSPGVRAPNPAEVLSESSLGFHSGLYRMLDHPRKGEAGRSTDVLISADRPGNNQYHLVDPSLAMQWNVEAREITIYNDHSLATFGASTGGKISGEFAAGVVWCTPDFFFSPRLMVEAGGSEAFPGAMPVQMVNNPKRRSVVLPLNPAVLNLLTPGNIQKNFSVEWLPDGSAVCRLKLRLRSSNGEERQARIERKYGEEEMIEISNLPLVSIWPNFRLKSNSWKIYYTFQIWAGSAQEEMAATPWSFDEKTVVPRKHNLDSRVFQVAVTSGFPEALICSNRFHDPSRMRDAEAQGVLLLAPPDPLDPPSGGEAVLGVDFGSTGTNVFVKRGDAEPGPITLQNRLFHVTDFSETPRRDLTRKYFVPARDWKAESILSIFHDFGDPANGSNERVPVRDGHVLFPDDPRQFIEGDANRVLANLKWGSERERIAARDFLSQLVLQALAELAVEGVTRVDLRFSFPTAFDKYDYQNFKGHWRYVAESATRNSGMKVEANRDPEVDTAEAINATRFFSEYRGGTERMDTVGGAVTLDIGGGTTDFAVWNENQLLSHSSVLFAGRDLFLRPIAERTSILKEIINNIDLSAAKIAERVEPMNPRLSAVISYHGDDLIRALPTAAARSSVQGLLSLFEIGLCGVMFYAGLLVRRLHEEGTFRPDYRIPIFVGGNGSKIFSWCGHGHFDRDTVIYDRASDAFLAGSSLSGLRVVIVQSERPKAEVAYGLVCPPWKIGRHENMSRPMNAESFIVNGERKPWTDWPSIDDIRGGKLKADRTMPVFAEFLRSIGAVPDQDLLHRLGARVDNHFVKLSTDVEQKYRKDSTLQSVDLRKEPIFIIALRSYLEMQIDAWRRRD